MTDLLPVFKLIRKFPWVEAFIYFFVFWSNSMHKTIIDCIKFWFVCEPVSWFGISTLLNHCGSASSVEEPSDAISPGRAQWYKGKWPQRRAKHLEASRWHSRLNFGSRGSPLPDHEWATQQRIFSKSCRTLLVTSYQSKLEITFHCNKEMIRLSVSLKCTHASGRYSQFQFLLIIPVSPLTPWTQMISPREEAMSGRRSLSCLLTKVFWDTY